MNISEARTYQQEYQAFLEEHVQIKATPGYTGAGNRKALSRLEAIKSQIEEIYLQIIWHGRNSAQKDEGEIQPFFVVRLESALSIATDYYHSLACAANCRKV